ncbi:MAG: hypothetical protein ACRD2L_19500, partial [Terriglobia bacterium]
MDVCHGAAELQGDVSDGEHFSKDSHNNLASDADLALRAFVFFASHDLIDPNQAYTYIEALKTQNLK